MVEGTSAGGSEVTVTVLVGFCQTFSWVKHGMQLLEVTKK